MPVQTLMSHGRNVVIAVMGVPGSGKTTFINLVSGSNLPVGTGLKACTSSVQASQPFELDGRCITLLDTPGFDDSNISDTDVLKMIATFLASRYENGCKLGGVIVLHRIYDCREYCGISRRNFRVLRTLCGDDTLKSVVIVTNMWGMVRQEIGEAHEAELASREVFYKPAIDNGAQILRHTNTLESGQAILRYLIHNNPLPIRAYSEPEIPLPSPEEIARKYREEIRALREEAMEAMREMDEASSQKLEMERGKLEAEIARVEAASQRQIQELKDQLQQMQGGQWR